MSDLKLVTDLPDLLEQVRSAVTDFNGFAAGTLPLPTNEDALYEDHEWIDASNVLVSLGEALSELSRELRAAAYARAAGEDADAE